MNVEDPFKNSGWRDIWSHVMAFVLTVLTIADGHFTSLMTRFHPEELSEQINPLWRAYVATHPLWQFIIFKTAFTLFAVAWVLLLKKSHARTVLAFLIGYYLNAVVIQLVHLM